MALTSKETNEIIKNKSLRLASKRRTATKVIIVVLLISLLLTGGTYGVISLIDANSMTISINNEKTGLSLSETRNFLEPTTNLKMGGPEKMDATTYIWLDVMKTGIGFEGKHHGNNFIGYSFYLKNVNETSPCTYTVSVEITKNTKNIASALRILLIEYEQLTQEIIDKGESDIISSATVYAKEKDDGTSEYIAYNDCVIGQRGLSLEELNGDTKLLNTNMAMPFVSMDENEEVKDTAYYAMKRTGNKLDYNSMRKYTVMIWFEGTDLQCVNDILGGKCSIDVKFELEEYLDPEYYGGE